MSLHETPLLRKYWKQVGGTLIEEYPAAGHGARHGHRNIDGIIIRTRRTTIAKADEVDLRGKHITIVQVKAGRLGMYLLGQAFFSIGLMEQFKPASIKSVALCEEDDVLLRPLFERFSNCHVVIASQLERRRRTR